jgi:type IV secretion system protein VirB1
MWAELATACAPNVATATIEDVIRVESGGDPLLVNINGTRLQPARAQTRDEAVALAQASIAAGYSVDLGLMQVNSRNLPALHLGLREVFEPCANIRAGAAILAEDFARAAQRTSDPQAALRAALSAYNTGDFSRGFSNGYVARYLHAPVAAAAGPAFRPASDRAASVPYNPYTADTEVVLDVSR